MRVKILTNPPLPPVKAWFPLPSTQSTPNISSFKCLLGASLPGLREFVPSALRLSIDGFELLDGSELTVVRDGDLVCVHLFDVSPQNSIIRDLVGQSPSHPTPMHLTLRKRKRRPSSSSSSESSSESESESEPESESESESSTSGSTSTSDSSCHTGPPLRKAEPPQIHATRAQTRQKPFCLPTFVPPGQGKPQTRARNQRRRLKRVYERETATASKGGPVSGANAVVASQDADAETVAPDLGWDGQSGLPSLSLRNKNKARNFKSLIGKPLPPKIIFGEQEGGTLSEVATPECPAPTQTASTRALPRLIPPSSRTSLPPNLFVTSVDVEAGLHGGKKKGKMHMTYGEEPEDEEVSLDYGDADTVAVPAPDSEADVARLEALAEKRWATLAKLTGEEQIKHGTIVGYKALGIHPVTYTPEQCLTVARVVSWDSHAVVVRPMRAQVSFGGVAEGEEEEHAWGDIRIGDWRLVPC